MDDFLKTMVEFTVQFVIEAVGHLFWAAVEHGLQQCRPRLGVAIVFCLFPLIASTVVGLVIHDSGFSIRTILVGGTTIALFAFPSAYCFLTLRKSESCRSIVKDGMNILA